MSFLELRGVAKTWPDGTQAVRSLDLSVAEGELVVLLGPSGCGKTTTLRMVAGLETPTSGRIEIAGEDVTPHPPARRDVGFVFQFYALYPHMSVARNIAFPLLCAGIGARERAAAVAEVARRLDLTDLLPRSVRELSGGDQQRVGLARAMVRRPKLWLMDEPLGTLDADRRAQMVELVRAQQLADRVTTLYVTHDQEEALRIGDRVLVMDSGRIVQQGPPRALYDEPTSLFVARFVGSPGMNLLDGEVRSGAFLPRGTSAALGLPQAASDGARVLGVRPEHVRLDPDGPLQGRVAIDAFAGAIRHLHVQGPGWRIVAQVAASERRAPGAEVRLGLDPRGVRLFDAGTGARCR